MTLRVLMTSLGIVWLLCAAPLGCAQAEDEKPLTKEQLQGVAKRGVAVVTAIHRYRQDHGLWPASLADLSPDHLQPGEAKGWRLHWRPDGWWHLTCFADYPRSAVRYKVRGEVKGWVVTDGIDDEPLGVKQPKAAPTKLTAEQVRKNTRAEFDRRIERAPKALLHYQGLVAHLYKGKEVKEARKVCFAVWRRYPDSWWTNMMLAKLDSELGHPEAAEARVRAWVGRHKDFSQRYFLAQFLHERGKSKEARAALRDASRYPLAVIWGPKDADLPFGIAATHPAWLGAMLAYRQGWFDVAHAVCDRWELYDRGYDRGHAKPAVMELLASSNFGTIDPGYWAIRTGCYLAQGKFNEATESMAATYKRLGDRNFGWRWNLDELEKAIKAKDTTFRYQPEEDWPTPLPLLIEYE